MANTRKRKTAVESTVVEEPVPYTEGVAETEPVVKTSTICTGLVKDCISLNVRSQPSKDADVVCIITNGSEVQIDKAASTKDFYKVYTTSGASGYAMKKFISITK